MKSITGKQFARVLERNGWELLRVNGSHHIYPCDNGLKAPSFRTI